MTLAFEVIPAIDLRGGRCVRLVQGDYARERRYADDPVVVARAWEDQGAARLHVVDLDGARQGVPVNSMVMAAICRAVSIPVEVSGGIRTLEAAQAAIGYGAGRVQLGSAAVRDPELVRAACAALPGAVVVSIDARDGEVMTDGWQRGSGRKVLEVAREMVSLGVPRLMFTDIGRDGVLGGPELERTRELVGAAGVPVVASGGVSRVEHLRQLAAIGCEGAIVDTALYEGAFTLAEALAAVGGRAPGER